MIPRIPVRERFPNRYTGGYDASSTTQRIKQETIAVSKVRVNNNTDGSATALGKAAGVTPIVVPVIPVVPTTTTTTTAAPTTTTAAPTTTTTAAPTTTTTAAPTTTTTTTTTAAPTTTTTTTAAPTTTTTAAPTTTTAAPTTTTTTTTAAPTTTTTTTTTTAAPTTTTTMFPLLPTGLNRSYTNPANNNNPNITYSVAAGTIFSSFTLYGPSTIDPGSIDGFNPVLSSAGTALRITYTYVSSGTIQISCSTTTSTLIITDGTTVYTLIASQNGGYSNNDNFPQQKILSVATVSPALMKAVLDNTPSTVAEYNANPFGSWIYTAQ